MECWYPDPKVPERQLGWCTQPHAYVKPTYQIVERSLNKKNQWHYRVVVTNLPPEVLFWLAQAHLAYNLLTCFRSLLAQVVPLWASYGVLRLIRDAFHISGLVQLGPDNRISALAFNQTHLLAKEFFRAFQPFKPHDLSLYLRKI
ncbi:MAG: hypothetical protein P8Y03_06185 [Anaerolineales bacterium]